LRLCTPIVLFPFNFASWPFGSFCGAIIYSIIWKNSVKDIRNGKINHEITAIQEKKGTWNHEIRIDIRSLGFAKILPNNSVE